MGEIRIVEITDEATFDRLPPCADPAFDHRTCDYWEDADRGSKAHRASWLPKTEATADAAAAEDVAGGRRSANPFAPDASSALANPFAPKRAQTPNPFAPPARESIANPFLVDDGPEPENPFAPKRPTRPTVAADAPRKLGLLGRGLHVFGSYAKVLLVDDVPAGYAQFGPLSAYPRALRLRELYPQLPQAPLPAVITCIATTSEGRDHGYAQQLIRDICGDLSRRGFSAVEAYPEARAMPDATSAASPAFWEAAGFTRVVADDRYPVFRRELG